MSILCLQADESSQKGTDAGPHRVVALPFTRPQKQEGCVKETPKPTCWAQHLVRWGLRTHRRSGRVLCFPLCSHAGHGSGGLGALLQVRDPSLYRKLVGLSDMEGRMDGHTGQFYSQSTICPAQLDPRWSMLSAMGMCLPYCWVSLPTFPFLLGIAGGEAKLPMLSLLSWICPYLATVTMPKPWHMVFGYLYGPILHQPPFDLGLLLPLIYCPQSVPFPEWPHDKALISTLGLVMPSRTWVAPSTNLALTFPTTPLRNWGKSFRPGPDVHNANPILGCKI